MPSTGKVLLEALKGHVIEIGTGNGLNFLHYPSDVSSVLAVEPERYLLRIARGNARRAPVAIHLVRGIAERLPAADATFDAPSSRSCCIQSRTSRPRSARSAAS